jgi:periplasmic protein TonB
MIAVRWLISIALGGLITLVLFYLMQALIATGEQLNQTSNVIRIVDATMPEVVMEVVREIEKPQPIEEQNEPPPPPDRTINMDTGPSLNIQRTAVNVDVGLNLGGASLNVSDGEMLPLVNVTPQYPTRAASRGIEGWCQVRFTVTEIGGVTDVVVVDGEPRGMFDQSSVRAAERFRFQPRVVNGEGVAVPGVQYVFRYQLEGDQ